MNGQSAPTEREGRTPLLILGAVFCLGLVPPLLLWDAIRLPFRNPWGVVGPLTEIQFNPNNNIVRFVLLVASPLVVLLLLYVLRRGRQSDRLFGRVPGAEHGPDPAPFGPPTPRLWSVLLFICVLILALNLPSYLTTGALDTHHEGESLGSAMSSLRGEVPYRDFLFVHGVYDDPLRSVVAFKFFGKSIGAARTLQSIHKLIVYSLLTLFLLQLFRGQAIYAGLTFLVLLICQSQPFLIVLPVTMPPRDMVTLAFLLTAGVLERLFEQREIPLPRLLPAAFLLGFWPVLAFWYSVDRGFYLSATFLVVAAMSLLLLPDWRRRCWFVLASAGGLVVALGIGFLLLRGGMAAFLEFTFWIMPQYKELMDGYLFHVFEMPYLLATLLVAVNTFWVFHLLLSHLRAARDGMWSGLRSFARENFLVVTLAVLGICFFRSALGRADITHLAYITSPSVILFAYLVVRSWLQRALSSPGAIRMSRLCFLTAVVVLALLGVVRFGAKGLWTWNFPYDVPDEEFIADDYKAAIHFLRANLSDADDFFTMTPEASWYYFLDRPCPTRFPTVWFAAPRFYQEEVVQALEKRHVLYVLHANHTSRISDISMQARMPIIDEYLRAHYRAYRCFGRHEVWVRKDFPEDGSESVASRASGQAPVALRAGEKSGRRGIQ